mmetsp:Transcript_20147/g.30174  ORF Transcript_20147/g.30174 Transcript_20147/m.30174 type:complete len:211 (+) Transcript_20147:1846-2478(+)
MTFPRSSTESPEVGALFLPFFSSVGNNVILVRRLLVLFLLFATLLGSPDVFISRFPFGVTVFEFSFCFISISELSSSKTIRESDPSSITLLSFFCIPPITFFTSFGCVPGESKVNAPFGIDSDFLGAASVLPVVNSLSMSMASANFFSSFFATAFSSGMTAGLIRGIWMGFVTDCSFVSPESPVTLRDNVGTERTLFKFGEPSSRVDVGW